ncbi:NADH pyrophosphatase zinc ribbon domain-containing protein [Candidatus Leptofilum sp.]|uniref:NADH pyrophosphatase zinc ribbon domain-containing protein n=1 Tax=Candidatus Leptofilum sp. TaxID=3241576 RepID=UPI003B59370D
MNDSNQCPECGGRLVFSADGRSRQCEQCNHHITVERQRESPQELMRLQQFSAGEGGFANVRTAGVRELLRQGVAATKAGDKDEAFHYLSWVLRTDSSEKQQAQAWLWLSEVYEKPAQKRHCLEQVLAFDPTHGVARRGLALLDGRLQAKDVIDPNKISQTTSEEPEQTAAEQFACPQCAGKLQFLADGTTLRCGFCGFEQTIGATEEKENPNSKTSVNSVANFGEGAFEQEFTTALARAKGHLAPVQMRTFQCNGCAVEFVLAPEAISMTCPYCDSTYVTETAASHNIMPPHTVIPFRISHEQAEKAIRGWLQEGGVERPSLSPIVGIYLPLWTFDVGGEIHWGGQVKKGDTWVPITGNHLTFSDDVRVPASKKLDRKLTKAFDGFDLDGLMVYDSRYLADWPAERHTIPLADASLQARKQVLQELRRNPRKLTLADVRNLKLGSLGLVVESFKLALVPIWLVHYQVDDETYDLLVNGQTGAVVGKRPSRGVRGFFAKLFG